MEKMIHMHLTTNEDLSVVTFVMVAGTPLNAEDIKAALKQYMEVFDEETVQ